MARVTAHREDDVEAGIVDVAGLHAVDAGNAAEQVIVVAHLSAVVGERARAEVVVVIRKAILDGAGENSHVARRGDLVIVGQTGRVAIDRVRHAERPSLGGHQLGKVILGTAERFGDDDRYVVGRLGDDGADRGFHGDGLARL